MLPLHYAPKHVQLEREPVFTLVCIAHECGERAVHCGRGLLNSDHLVARHTALFVLRQDPQAALGEFKDLHAGLQPAFELLAAH